MARNLVSPGAAVLPPAGTTQGGRGHKAPHCCARIWRRGNPELVERVRAIKEAQWAEEVRIG